MTKSKTIVLLESRREPTLESRPIADRRVLFGDNQQQQTSTEHWLDPYMLCKSDAYQITVNCKLPERYQTLIHRELGSFLRVKASLKEDYLALLTTTHFYLYLRNSHRHIAHPIAQLYKADSVDPLFDILLDQDNSTEENQPIVKIVTVDRRGSIILFVHHGDKFIQTFNTIPLYQPYEYITAVKWIHADQILIGSSTGQTYLLNPTSDNAQVLTLCKQDMSGPLGFVKSLYTTPLPHASECLLPKTGESGPIVNISTVDDLVYVCSQYQVSIWTISSRTEAQLIARISLGNEITDCIFPHVPKTIEKYRLKCRIVTMDIETPEELVLLVSYTVPGSSSDFMQYAVIKFSVIHNNGTVMMYPQHTASLPYSEILSTSSITPRLSITKDIAFVAFEGTVVARSLSKVSVFEESLVLKHKEDMILAVHVMDSSESFDTALVVTAKSGVLEFKVNKNQIQGPGNIYAGVVENADEGNTMVLKSRLEQALFFGAYNESPLQFPLLREHKEDVGVAVFELTDDIRSGQCRFLPKTLDISPIESRFYFQNRMYKILQDQMLDQFLSAEQRSRLFDLLEMYYLSKQLWKMTQEKSADVQWMKYVTQNSQEVLLQTTTTTTDQTNSKPLPWVDFLTDHIDKIKDFISHMATHSSSSCADDIIPRIIQKCRSFEDINLPRYSIQQPPKNNFSAQACEHLVRIFDQKVAHYTTHSPNDDQKTQLQDMATLLLDIHRKQPYIEDYNDMKKRVLQGLTTLNWHQAVVDLADEHNEIQFIVTSVPHLHLSSDAFREKSRYYVDRFGYPYFESLLQQLDFDKREDIWYFCEQYPAFTDAFFSNEQQHLPKVAWIYHIKKGNYKKAHEILSGCEDGMSEKEHRLAHPWIKMLCALREGRA